MFSPLIELIAIAIVVALLCIAALRAFLSAAPYVGRPAWYRRFEHRTFWRRQAA